MDLHESAKLMRANLRNQKKMVKVKYIYIYCNRNKCFDEFINRLDRKEESINEAEDRSIGTV